jgi:adenylyltransferase/sulfurtransferase
MNDEQLLRYNRQIMLPDLDVAGQQRLLDSTVLLVGLGGLGCPVAMYLAAAGIGRLILVDHDEVEISNLQRQIAHGTSDIGKTKVGSAAQTVAELNPDIQVTEMVCKLDANSMAEVVGEADLVVDATDNFTTRFALNQACVSLKKPLVSGAAIRHEGQVAVFDSRDENSPCYHCLYDDQATDSQLSCSENGVLSPLVGIIGAMQALEAIRLLAGYGESSAGSMLVFDGKHMEWRKLKIPKSPNCRVCAG